MNRMGVAGASIPRISVDGKFFRAGEKKFHIKGVAYGPFAPNAAGQPFSSPEQTAKDFELIQKLGANTVRIYHPPAKWFLELAGQYSLRLLVDIPWNQHLSFLESEAHRAAACDAVRRAVFSSARHPAIFAYSVANEIPADIVRWSGPRAVADFLDNLVAEAKRVDPECLCTFTNFPTTEYLRPASVDFVCFNVYLHHRTAFKNYLARLQMVAGPKPLLLGELGFDSVRDGEKRQAELLSSQLEETFREGLAGAVVFSFTDDWWRGGAQVEGWQMGLTDRERVPKPAFAAVQQTFNEAPYLPLRRSPKISVVVACYNGERTLKTCLESLQKLNYPEYEVL